MENTGRRSAAFKQQIPFVTECFVEKLRLLDFHVVPSLDFSGLKPEDMEIRRLLFRPTVVTLCKPARSFGTNPFFARTASF